MTAKQETKHTPGPWKANDLPKPYFAEDDSTEHLACAVWAGDIPICSTRFSVGKYSAVDAHTQHANALLIASAPRLAEENAEMRDIIQRFIQILELHDTPVKVFGGVMERAKAILSEVER